MRLMVLAFAVSMHDSTTDTAGMSSVQEIRWVT